MTDSAAPDEIVDRPELSRFELVRGEQVLGFSEYRRKGGALTITHTEIDPQLQEHGLGSKLAEGMLGQLRGSGEKIVASCAFITHYIDENPEWADLLAE